MIEDWIVFKDKATGKELLAYTVRGTFPGEMDASIELLATENGIPAEQIAVSRETRPDSARPAGATATNPGGKDSRPRRGTRLF